MEQDLSGAGIHDRESPGHRKENPRRNYIVEEFWSMLIKFLKDKKIEIKKLNIIIFKSK